MQAKSKVKQAANDFVVKRCSSNPTSDYFDPLKKTKLKSLKNPKAVDPLKKTKLKSLKNPKDVTSRRISSHCYERCFHLSSWSSSLVSC